MTATVRLTDIEQRLGLFAAGITGRYHEIEPLDAATGDATGRAPRVDAVYLPAEYSAFPDRSHNLGAYRVMALHQLGYREFGTYDFRIDAARARCPALRVRPRPDLGIRQSDFATCFGHFPAPWLARTLFELLEAHRIDRCMLRKYPGIAPHHRRVATLELGRRGPMPIDPLAGLLEATVRWTLGGVGAELIAADPTGLLHGIIAASDPVRSPAADVYDAVEAMARVLTTLEAAGLVPSALQTVAPEEVDFEPPERPEFQGDGPDDWLQREARLADWMADLDALDAQIDEAERGETEGEGMARPTDQGLRSLKEARDTLARRVGMERAAVDAATDPDRGERRRYWYPEWDDPGKRYLPRWCRLYEERLEDAMDADVGAFLRRVARHRSRVRERFARLPLEALRRERHIVDGEDLDWDALIRYRVDRRRGDVPDERVYERRERTARDVAAAFLVDLSASTDDPTEKPTPPESAAPAPDGPVNLRDPWEDDPPWSADRRLEPEEPPRRIVDVLKESLLLMAAGLNDYGDVFGIYGFSGYGRHCVEYYVAKEFRDRWTPATLRALASMRPRRSTRMGPAIRHTTQKLAATGAALQVMVVLSDGFPQDSDYGPDRGEHGYGVADTAQALHEAELRGIATFCLTVDRSGHDYLKAMCPDERYLIIEDIESLPDALVKVYRRLTSI